MTVEEIVEEVTRDFMTIEAAEKAIYKLIDAEREACARIAEGFYAKQSAARMMDSDAQAAGEEIALEIRERAAA